MLWLVPGSGGVVDDQEHGIPEGVGATPIGSYTNQFGNEGRFQWDPGQRVLGSGFQATDPDYLLRLLAFREGQGTLKPYEEEELRGLRANVQAIPTRDIASLTAGWQGDLTGTWTENGWQPGAQDWWSRLDPGSPDAAPIMLALRDKIDAGTATAQERDLYSQVGAMAEDWSFRANKPQPSDASPFGLGDQLFGALLTLGMGATGGLAGGALAAGTAGLGSTLGSIGSLASVAGTGAGMVGQATDQDWLSNLGLGLGIAGGLAGGIGGLSTLASSGVNSLTDAARLAQSAGKITGALGRIPGAEPLKDVSRYLGYAGQAGNLASGAADWLGLSGGGAPGGTAAAPQGVSQLLSAADVATQRGGGNMSEWDFGLSNYDEPIGPGLGWDMGGYDYSNYSEPIGPGLGWDAPFGGMTPEQQAAVQGELTTMLRDPAIGGFGGGGGSNWLQTLAKTLLGGGGGAGGGGILGPLLSSLGSVGAGAIGSNAANEAARLQSQALNRGIDLQTAQWLQQQQNLAPYLQAGQQGLSTLQSLAGREQPGLPQTARAPWVGDYSMPSAQPGWTPQTYQGPGAVNAGDYRWTPGQGPSAQDYRYTPGTIPAAANYRYTPGAVPTLSGKELLANDPGYQFRMDEARKAVEGSAAARGDLLSGQNLKALQARSQDLASQEYGQAWNRASQQAQLREQWGQAASQMGWQQAEAESRLREQVNQIASQQGWTQAQAEAVFREQQAQLASQQGWQQALQGQQNQFTQGLQAQQWNQHQQQQYGTEQYQRGMEQNRYIYGADVARNATDYAREQDRYRQQMAQFLLPYEQQSTIASLGGQAVGMYGNQGQSATSAIANLLGQQGTAQAMGTLGSAGQWNQAISGGVGGVQNILRGLNA